jgi:Domain of unknown function (DUF4347)/Calx-beta domain/PKD domain
MERKTTNFDSVNACVTSQSYNFASELVIVDERVPDLPTLLHGLRPNIAVCVVNSDQYPIESISSILEQYSSLHTLHLVTHGQPGTLILGNSDIDEAKLFANAQQVKKWAQAFVSEGELIVYGCQVAQGSYGKSFINKLHQLTELSVAASETKTGAENLGGDWQFQIGLGDINGLLAFNQQTQASWNGVLADEVTPTVSVAGASTTEGTSGGDPFFLNYVVTLSAPATEAVTVFYRLLSGTAQARSDAYFQGFLSVTFAAGETSQTVSVRVDGDNVVESDEAVVLEVYNATGAVLAGQATTLRATGWILDDDGEGNKLALFVSNPTVVEGNDGNQQATFEVSLSRPAPAALSLTYQTVDGSAVAGEDYQAVSGTLDLVAGQTSASVAVPVLGDAELEGSELFTLAFKVPEEISQVSQGEATLFDDDAGTPTVSVAGASTTEGTSGGDPFFLNYVVTLSAPATEAVTVFYRLLSGTAQARSDAYIQGFLSVTIAAGETSQTISVRVDADSVAESDEAVVLEVYNATGAVLAGQATTLKATGWILDDDGEGNKLALYVEDAEIIEGINGYNRYVAIPIRLSRPAPEDITLNFQTINGSALEGQDFVQTTGTVSFVKGQTTAAALVPVTGDNIEEIIEQFTLIVTPTEIIANGVDGAAGVVTVVDGNIEPSDSLSLTPIADQTINEGGSVDVQVNLTDYNDANYDGWVYQVDWENDGVIDETGTIAPGSKSFNVNREFLDDSSIQTTSIKVIDFAGFDEETVKFNVTVNNVAPTIALNGASKLKLGQDYSLSLGNVTDPGDDNVTQYLIDWGDGSPIQSETSVGEFTHTYANIGDFNIKVALVDEDGTHADAGTETVNVTLPDKVDINVGENQTINEGDNFFRIITITDGLDSGADGWNYEIDWDNDGTVDETGSVAADVQSFEISRIFPDESDSQTVSIKVIDQQGVDENVSSFDIKVNNVAPTLELSGEGNTAEGLDYALTLSNLIDPGSDTVSNYTIDWGDGSMLENIDALGTVNHVYEISGKYEINVNITDEDGVYLDIDSLSVSVDPFELPETIKLGDAPSALSRLDRNAWDDAWSNDWIDITHKADYSDALETWSNVTLTGSKTSELGGGDIYAGNLGVSGQTLLTSQIRQEIDGTEALRFELNNIATRVTVDIANLEGNETDNIFESGRLQVLDDQGLVVDEIVFQADSAANEKQISLQNEEGFVAVVLTAGAYEDLQFQFGGNVNAEGALVENPKDAVGFSAGSDFNLDAIEFEFKNGTANAPKPVLQEKNIVTGTSEDSQEVTPVLFTDQEDVFVIGISENDLSDDFG